MGNVPAKPIKYCTPVTLPGTNETAIYRTPLNPHSIVTSPEPNMITIQDIHLHNFKTVPDKKYLGWRKVNPVTKELTKELEYLTYAQTEQAAK
jgi:hypothetical protein